MITTFRNAVLRVADAHVLGPVRVAVGVLLGWQALLAAEEFTKLGFFGESFHLPMVPAVLVPSHRVFGLMLAVRVCLAVTVTLGVWARPALAVSAALGLWCFACDQLQFDDGRYRLFAYALLLSLTPCDRSWRASEPISVPPRSGAYWAVFLIQFQVALFYLASGFAKLLNEDWRTGAVLLDQIGAHADMALAAAVPRAALQIAANHAGALAKIAIMTELFLGVGLCHRSTRVVALWLGVWYHAIAQFASTVETSAFVTLAMYGVFATPDFAARELRFDPSRLAGRLLASLVPPLDWLARFDVRPWEPDDRRGHAYVVVRRDGTRVTGIHALCILTRCLPVLFPFWAPVALVASFTRKGDLTTQG